MSATPTFMTVTPSHTLTWPSDTAAATTSSSYSLTLFVGNTPSTVLFFLAMSVGVAIAGLFIFFTVRYFVRLRYGLHVYPVSSRGLMFSLSFADPGVITYTPSNREIREHLDYLRTHHFLRDEFLERRLMASGRRRRRRRRGRYAKMKKLSPAEVERLFPKRLYAEWMHLGDDAASTCINVVHENHSLDADSVVLRDAATPQQFDVIELHDMHPRDGAADPDVGSLAVLDGAKGELHFDLGCCAICLELFEDDDVVRGLVCGHVFHAECVDPWLTRRRACCPICKRDYYKEEAETKAEATEAAAEGAAEGASTAAANGAAAPDNGAAAFNREAAPIDPPVDAASNNTPVDAPADAPVDAVDAVDAADAAAAADRPEGEASIDNSRDATPVPANADATDAADADGERQRRRRDRDDDEEPINYDFLRTDPNLQALLNELIPLSERVRVILAEHPELNLEDRAKEMAAFKYRTVWRVIFWKLMGISRKDLFNWAVIQIYQQEQSNDAASTTADADAATRVDTGELVTDSTTGEVTDNTSGVISASVLLRTSGASTPVSAYHNAAEELDLSEAARQRDTVADRV